ncbi:MAG: xylose isomerase domain protein barrel [Subtercola sp.]|nr:xylose isomerase domain protein barrel [Subtercola sp.]
MNNMPHINLGVTLHSFSVEYYTYQYTMEDCMAAVGSLGPDLGVELVGPQMIRGFPDLSAEFANRFTRAVEKYDLRPTAYGAYGDAQLATGKWVSREEQLDYLRRQIRAAQRLGFPLIRVQPSEAVLTDLVTYAEKHGVKMVIEIHAPMAIENIEPLIERVESVNSPYLGFAPDTGMFCHTVANVAVDRFRRLGVSAELTEVILQRWHEQVPEAELLAEIRRLGGGHDALQFAFESTLHWGHSDPATLQRIMPYINHVHGKFFNADNAGVDTAVRFAEVIGELRTGEYNGSISFEYDGHLWNPTDHAIEQIRRLYVTTLRQLESTEA